MSEKRPNPEHLLHRIQQEEQQAVRGKLKIYLGAAPGVGKTYSMLQDALEKRRQGLDIVIGVAESHGRQEIEKLIQPFEILPKQSIDYRDKKIAEFDLDAALKRNPAVILIDEMAHTNAPGLRHSKRWQDIKELLDRGIDVYTTLNIQHIESLNDVISQIIHSSIQETVPDSMLELADTIELVDLPPEDLLKRLQEGKIYFPAQAELAKEHFFRKGNLIALRELALRTTAERVSSQVLLYRQGEGIKHIWPTKEKLLVCIGPGAESIKLIRTAKRLATNLKTHWMALAIETPYLQSSEKARNKVIQYLRLAEQLGAETKILPGFDIISDILNFAREQNISQIMIYRKERPRWKELFSKNLADEMVRRSGEIDVYVITGHVHTKLDKTLPALKRTPPWHIYAITLGIVGMATLINFLISPFLNASNLIMVYLLGVTLVALFGRTGPSILASIISVLAYGFLFMEPYYSLTIANIEYFITLIVMLIVAQVISHLTIITRKQAETARATEKQTAALHTLSRQLASTRGVENLLDTGLKYIGEDLNCEALVLLPVNHHLTVRAKFKTDGILNVKELGVAQWVYELGQMAGFGTDTLSFSDALYLPLLGAQNVMGVLRVKPFITGRLFSPEQMQFLESAANQIALAIEVDRLQELSKKSELKVEADLARSHLLQSVAHDLRTPLVAVMGTATTLMENDHELSKEQIKKFGKDIYTESEQLSRLINNLLQITYLEASNLQLEKKLGSIHAIIAIVVQNSKNKVGKRPIHLKLADTLPEVFIDEKSIQEVIINLLDNAIKFTPHDSAITIATYKENKKIIVSIEDNGPGIMPDEMKKLFEKFYRGRGLTSTRGLGLGLAICHHIIKAHGGEIWAENNSEGGAVFRFSLPCS